MSASPTPRQGPVAEKATIMDEAHPPGGGVGQPRAVPTPEASGPRLLDRVRQAIRTRHYSPRTERAYAGWIRRYILYHQKRHPSEMGTSEVTQFLSALATSERVSASTQNQALC